MSDWTNDASSIKQWFSLASDGLVLACMPFASTNQPEEEAAEFIVMDGGSAV